MTRLNALIDCDCLHENLSYRYHTEYVASQRQRTAVYERPRNAPCYFAQLLHNSTTKMHSKMLAISE